jgi:predicted RNA-binding Zn-ribbon protein involved in translation (DUF1610 family)
MSQDTYCPRCGGLIFSTGLDAEQMLPCTCTKTGDPSLVQPARPSGSMAPSSRESGSGVATQPVVGGPKVCIKCGTDLAGKRRAKDREGNYWCYDCGKKDEVRRHRESLGGPVATCSRCSKEVAVINMLSIDGKFVCPRCVRDEREAKNKVEARVSRINSALKAQEWKRLVPLLAIGGVLLLIIILRQLGIIGT